MNTKIYALKSMFTIEIWQKKIFGINFSQDQRLAD